MNLDRRITRVEERLGHRGPCPLCWGHGGGPRIVKCRPGETPPAPPGCRRCGDPPPHYKVLVRCGADPQPGVTP